MGRAAEEEAPHGGSDKNVNAQAPSEGSPNPTGSDKNLNGQAPPEASPDEDAQRGNTASVDSQVDGISPAASAGPPANPQPGKPAAERVPADVITLDD